MSRRDQTPAPDRGGGAGGTAASGVFAAAGLIAVVTLAARLFGFGRWLVFSQSVGATCVGNVYQAANQLPNVVFEVAAGGALAAVVVPIIAGQLARRDQAGATEADQTASAMLTWALTVLVPLSILMAAAAGPLSTLMVDSRSCAGSADLMASMLVVFSPQIALYGIGIVLSGILQAHRRFLGAVMAPLLSSLVVIVVYLSFGTLAHGTGNDLALLPSQASTVLAAGTTLGVVALSLPLLVPVRRAGIRLRLTWTFPGGVARRASVLAGAGLTALVAQQVAVLATLWVSQHRGGTGTLNVYLYVQAVYLLPYAVLAVPVAMSAFPSMASGPQEASRARAQSTLAASARVIFVATCAGAAVLVAIASPVGTFFTALDAGRHSAAGRDALAALPAALSAFAPGLVGFGMGALLMRALYVQGRPAVAGGLVAVGWLIAAIVPLAVLDDGAGPRDTLQMLGLASSLGMTVAAVGLFVEVRHAWGPQSFRGFGHSAVAALGAGAISAIAGRALSWVLEPDGLASAAAAAAVVAIAVSGLFAVAIWTSDRELARLAAARLPAWARRETTR